MNSNQPVILRRVSAEGPLCAAEGSFSFLPGVEGSFVAPLLRMTQV